MKLKLKRHWRETNVKFHKLGSVIEVADAIGQRLVNSGAAVEVLDENLAPDPADEAPKIATEAPDENLALDPENEPTETATDDALPKPKKTDKLEVWQKYARSQGRNPEGMTLADLRAAFA